MDLVVYALCKKLISKSIESLGEVFSIKGMVASKDNLPSSGNKSGDLYLVGPNIDGSYDEYFWTANGTWELLGSTATGLDGYINEETMYKGPQGTGTIENPAEDTIIYIVNNANRSTFLAKDNSVAYTPTQNYHPATKKYVDDNAISFKPFPNDFNTTGTTLQFLSSIRSLNLPAGSAYLGQVSLSDMPEGVYIQGDVEVYIYPQNVIYCIMKSAEISPYQWWCNSYEYRGWESFDQETRNYVDDAIAAALELEEI